MTMPPAQDALLRACREIVLPLVQADGGEVYLVSLTNDEVALHLSGACAGCPGISLTSQHIIEPALHRVAEGLRVIVTAGATIPKGATQL